jgi:hypothetical protein
MKKIFFIHANTVPVNISGQNVQMIAEFVVASGYVTEMHEKDHHNPGDYNPVFSSDNIKSVEYKNYIPDVFFNSYEEGCKVLTTLLSRRCEYDLTIREIFEKLVKHYPEYAI